MLSCMRAFRRSRSLCGFSTIGLLLLLSSCSSRLGVPGISTTDTLVRRENLGVLASASVFLKMWFEGSLDVSSEYGDILFLPQSYKFGLLDIGVWSNGGPAISIE